MTKIKTFVKDDNDASETFFVRDGSGDSDVDDAYVIGANINVSEASKLSAGARIFRGPESLVKYETKQTLANPNS